MLCQEVSTCGTITARGFLLTKRPASEAPAPAAMVKNAWLYTAFIVCDSLSQSAGESWMMQRESIQRYSRSNHLHTRIASRNVVGRRSRGSPASSSALVADFNVMTSELPHRWLSATYAGCPSIWFLSISLTTVPDGPTRLIRSSRRGIQDAFKALLLHAVCFVQQLLIHAIARFRLVAESFVSSGSRHSAASSGRCNKDWLARICQ